MSLVKWPGRYALASWQLDFAKKYVEQRKPRSLLVARPGTGKTISALYAARLMREQSFSDSLIVLNDLSALKEQWRYVAGQVGFSLSDSIDNYSPANDDGLSISVQSLNSDKRLHKLLELAKNSNWFGIIDEAHRSNKTINSVVDEIISANTDNRFLFISSAPPKGQDSFDFQFRFDTEYIFQDSVVKLSATKIEIARFSPSFSILEKMLKRGVQIDELNWREFEKLISELLEKDGYQVELMRGTKDGGVDVVAIKEMGEAGSYKTLWQAKKHMKNKVGLSVIRELADTRSEFQASKGIIVTSTYLTRDALARVQRDKYILGKVDRKDLNDWVQRTLLGEQNEKSRLVL